MSEGDTPLPVPVSPVGSAVAGMLSAALALGVSELAAGISNRLESFVVAVAGAIVDGAPLESFGPVSKPSVRDRRRCF